MREAHKILLKTLMTEKTTSAQETYNKYTFVVSPSANKVEIATAIEQAFSLRGKVKKVSTVNMLGKTKRRGRSVGKRPDWKKAIVTLFPGASIEYFEDA